MKRIVFLILIFSVVCAARGNSQSRATFQIGIIEVTDRSHDYWGPGYGWSLYALHYSNPNVAFGINFGMNTNMASSDIKRFNINARLISIELMPMLRIQTNRPSSSWFNVYFQSAIGLAIVDGSKVYETPLLPPPACVGCSTISDGGENLAKAGALGMNFGVGLISNNFGKFRYDMTLLYHIGLSEPERNEFVSLSFGVMLGE
jgi:hypothetical protein